jgi:hypothetical protein
MPETPAPSSRTVEWGVRREFVKKGLEGEERKVEKRGVMSHTTVGKVSFLMEREVNYE